MVKSFFFLFHIRADISRNKVLIKFTKLYAAGNEELNKNRQIDEAWQKPFNAFKHKQIKNCIQKPREMEEYRQTSCISNFHNRAEQRLQTK